MESFGKLNGNNWVVELKMGSRLALNHFYNLYYQPLCYFATRLTQDEEEAKDIVAECFYKVWKKHLDFQTDQNIKAFLYITCRNSCLQFLRNLKRKTVIQQSYFNQLEQSSDNILKEIIEAELLQLLNTEISLLPKKCAEVFKLIYFEGKKTDEIALQLDISVKTVRNHKANAIELLKTSLLKKGITGSVYAAFLLFISRF